MKETRKAGRIGLIPGTLMGTVAMPNGIASPNAGPAQPSVAGISSALRNSMIASMKRGHAGS